MRFNGLSLFMFEHIDEKVIATTAIMMRSGHRGTIIIVEGRADKNIYSNFMDCNECKFVMAHGKKNALGATKILNTKNFENIITIVDADFWHLEGVKPECGNIFVTDTHDLETMILKTDILERIISEYVDYSKARNLEKSVDRLLLENAFVIGLFKWINSKSNEDLCLNFKDLTYEEFIDLTTFKININKLIYEVKTNSNNFSINDDVIKQQIKELKILKFDYWQVCSGHDLTRIFALGLNRVFGFNNDGVFTQEGIEKLIRVAYGSSQFSMSLLYKAIHEWESRNRTIVRV